MATRPMRRSWLFLLAGWPLLAQEVTRVDSFGGGGAVVFDQPRNCLVAVHLGSSFLETWELHGAGWLFRNRTPNRGVDSSAVFHDAQLGRTVVLPLGSFGEARGWDGFEWRTMRQFQSGPLARFGGAHAWDPIRRELLYFAGYTFAGPSVVMFQDTWAWDGNVWRQIAGLAPPARADAALGFDPVRRQMVMFGGVDGIGASTTLLGDTWVFDGVQWSARPGGGPAPRARHTMAWDDASQRVVLFGGQGAAGFLTDTWLWDGVTWTQAAWSPPGAPTGERLWPIPGGLVRWTRDVEAGSLWQWNGTSWLPRVRTEAPIARVATATAYDPVRRNVVLFGGAIDRNAWPDTWTWDGRWRAVRPQRSPPARYATGMAFHAARGEMVLFAGLNGVQALDDTWVFDGLTWTERIVGIRPPRHIQPILAEDGVRGEIVLFGGSQVVAPAGNTWLWNGAGWRQYAGLEPAARVGHVLVGDEARRRVVLAGGVAVGQGAGSALADLWEWDGTAWTQSPTMLAVLAPAWYEPGVGVVALRDGVRRAFDGVAWRTLDAAPIPGMPPGTLPVAWHRARARALIASDHATGASFVIGPTPSSAVTVGVGCGAPAPRLAAVGRPRLGEFEFRFEVDGVMPAAPTFLLLGLGDQGPIVGGCQVLVSSLVMNIPSVTDPNSRVVVPMPIPDVLGIRGLSLFGQAAVIQLNGPAAGFALSAGLAIRVGD